MLLKISREREEPKRENIKKTYASGVLELPHSLESNETITTAGFGYPLRQLSFHEADYIPTFFDISCM